MLWADIASQTNVLGDRENTKRAFYKEHSSTVEIEIVFVALWCNWLTFCFLRAESASSSLAGAIFWR
jgi:hypothetical protein